MSGLILIVEDEQDLVSTLEYNLKREGFTTRSALTGRSALELADQDPPPDLVLLDLMLPDLPGSEVCRQLRAGQRTRDVPILMLTARGEEIDRVVGFELGADDYVVKPFSVRELVLRIRAILKRRHTGDPDGPQLVLGPLRINREAHRVWVEDQEVILTAIEFRLLTVLATRLGRVQERDVLLRDVWGTETHVTTRTVDTHIKRLRQKLGSAGDYIETVRGVGYRFRSDPDGEVD
jgi:two-component system phosphate regulon response regulator PhoB